MLGLLDILTIVKAVLQFPQSVLALVKLLQKTPQEKHEELLIRMADESKKFEETGRPTWN